jgi:hypothetical protein
MARTKKTFHGKNQEKDEEGLEDKKSSSSSVRTLVDENGYFEIFPNGNSKFLTKHAMQKVLEASSSSRAKRKGFVLKEPLDEYGSAKYLLRHTDMLVNMHHAFFASQK